MLGQKLEGYLTTLDLKDYCKGEGLAPTKLEDVMQAKLLTALVTVHRHTFCTEYWDCCDSPS